MTAEALGNLRIWWGVVGSTEIGRRLGTSKNAIVSKAHHLGLPLLPSRIKQGPEWLEMRARAAQLAADGLSAKEVAASTGICRETARLIVRQTPVRAGAFFPFVAMKPVAVAPKPIPVKPPPVVAAPAPVAVRPESPMINPEDWPPPTWTPRVVASASRGECCWPIGHPRSREFRFCGDPAEPKRPYCAVHVRIGYVRMQPRATGGLDAARVATGGAD
jgi:GcrA cell cycle regulator